MTLSKLLKQNRTRLTATVVMIFLSCGSPRVAPPSSHYFAYVTNEISGDVSIIDTRSNNVVSTIDVTGQGEYPLVGNNPRGIAITPDGALAYVADEVYEDLGDEISVSGEISVIDTSRKLVVGRIPFSEIPSGVAIAPDGAFAYVANGEFLSVVEVVSNRVIARVSLGTERFARAVAISPDGTSAYVTTFLLPSSGHSELSSEVSRIDVRANIVVATIPVRAAASNMAITPNGAFVYVVSDGDGYQSAGAVSVIDTRTNAVTATINVGAGPVGVAINKSGTFAYVTNSYSNTVSVIETTSNTVTATIPVGRLPEGIAITPNGGLAYVTNRLPSSSDYSPPIGRGNVMVIDTSTNTVVTTVPVGWSPSSIAVF